jgi:hypothetical protein
MNFSTDVDAVFVLRDDTKDDARVLAPSEINSVMESCKASGIQPFRLHLETPERVIKVSFSAWSLQEWPSEFSVENSDFHRVTFRGAIHVGEGIYTPIDVSISTAKEAVAKMTNIERIVGIEKSVAERDYAKALARIRPLLTKLCKKELRGKLVAHTNLNLGALRFLKMQLEMVAMAQETTSSALFPDPRNYFEKVLGLESEAFDLSTWTDAVTVEVQKQALCWLLENRTKLEGLQEGKLASALAPAFI